MKIKYIKNSLLCFGMVLSAHMGLYGSQEAAAFSSSCSSSSSDINEVGKKIDQLNLEGIKQISDVRASIKANPEGVLNYCASLVIKDFEKNNQMIDSQLFTFFNDENFFNNEEYKKYFEQYYKKNPVAEALIHYKITREYGKHSISAHQGIFPRALGVMGKIDYVSHNVLGYNPEIKGLSVLSTARKQGIATQLLKRALVDLKSMSEQPKDVHFLAFPLSGGLHCQHGIHKPPLTLDQLIAFYQKRGAVLIQKNTITANMKFPA